MVITLFFNNFFFFLGLGYADLENRIPCTPETVMRIASISKPLTAAAAALLCEEGKLKLDVPVQEYVPEFPQKHFDGKVVSQIKLNLNTTLKNIYIFECVCIFDFF